MPQFTQIREIKSEQSKTMTSKVRPSRRTKLALTGNTKNTSITSQKSIFETTLLLTPDGRYSNLDPFHSNHNFGMAWNAPMS